MKKRRKRPRKKNKKIWKVILIVGVLVVFIFILFSFIPGKSVPSVSDAKIGDYKKAAQQTGCTWQELIVYDAIRYENNIDDANPYVSSVDFMKMYYEIYEPVEAEDGDYWTLVSGGILTTPESICAWLGIPGNSQVSTILQTSGKYKKPEFFVQLSTKNLDDLMMEKGFSDEQIQRADMLMNSGELEKLFGNVYALPEYIKTAKGGYFQWPTPELHEVTSQFASARKHPVFGMTRVHNGVDISGSKAMGSPVVAIDDGVVIYVNLNGGERGINVKVQHNIGDDVWVSRYQHLAVASVTVGQKVTKGEIIGSVGDSGVGTGPHLHLEVTYNGVPVNPLQLIQ